VLFGIALEEGEFTHTNDNRRDRILSFSENYSDDPLRFVDFSKYNNGKGVVDEY